LGRLLQLLQPLQRRRLDHFAAHAWQAYLGRRVTITLNWAGLTSSRSETFSSIRCLRPPQHAQFLSATSMMISSCGRYRARRKRFRDDPPLVRVTPPSPATNAAANLDAPSRRGSVNCMVYHICEPMPINRFASSELCRSLQDGGKTPLIRRECGCWWPRSQWTSAEAPMSCCTGCFLYSRISSRIYFGRDQRLNVIAFFSSLPSERRSRPARHRR